nr:antibiotic biosynthesis monooxygenase [Erythrobacter sp. F6033]
MYGLIGQMKVADGKRGEVIAAMLAGTRDMPGNIAYMIAEDLDDPNSIWITEVWQTKTDHANSLQLPGVQEAIGKARAHITGFGTRVETKPIVRG